METRYILNNYYLLRHDLKRSYIISSKKTINGTTPEVQMEWTSRIHPILAMALSLFSEPHTLDELKGIFSDFFCISEEEADKFIRLFIDNPQSFTITYENIESHLPKNIIINADQQFVAPILYTPEQFAYEELEMKRERPYLAPLSLVFMANNTCATDCVYCYANKSVKPALIEFDRLKEIIKEAHELKIPYLTLVGGEVILYKHWEKLLQLLKSYDMLKTTLSTKVPIDEKVIAILKKYDINIQISLDAIHSGRLQQILKVGPSYADNIKRTIQLLDKYHVRFQIATVLTKYNSLPEDLNDIYHFLQPLKHMHRWEIRVAFKSLYSRGDFQNFKLSKEEIQMIDKWVNETKQHTNMPIQWSIAQQRKYFVSKNGSRSFEGSRCSANYSNLFILPDGKVTICEQLYWNPRFIIGDLNKQSIQEVWNSPKALSLAFPKKEDFREKSACRSCKLFDDCMEFPNRCIADILKGYGEENWDYPDPRCVKAPKFIYNLLSE